MHTNAIHILNTEGILASFSIAKTISEANVLKYFKKYKKMGKTDDEIRKMFIDKIENEILNAMNTGVVPGLISDEELNGNVPKELSNISVINKLIVSVSHKIMALNLNKITLCYIINSLVNLLNLSEDDFEKFHKLNGTDNNDEDEGADEGLDEDAGEDV